MNYSSYNQTKQLYYDSRFDIYAKRKYVNFERRKVFQIYVNYKGKTDLLFHDLFIGLKRLCKFECREFYLLENTEKIIKIVSFPEGEILNAFSHHYLVKGYKREIYSKNGENDDFVFFINNEVDKLYFGWSLREGYLFGPQKYSEFARFANGAILDDKIAIDDNDGVSYDISSYKEIVNKVYYSKEEDHYLYLYDRDKVLFVSMEEKDDVVVYQDFGTLIEYNKLNNQVTIKDNNDYTDWSQYNDIAYEGHSGLELGIED